MNGFSYKTKLAASIASGVPLEGNHADHIVPKSKGGSNDVTNCQIISPKANMMKSDNEFVPRAWQKKFIGLWKSHNPERPFLLNAIPGSGKTLASLKVAYDWWSQDQIGRKVVVVVPVLNIRDQWMGDAVRQQHVHPDVICDGLRSKINRAVSQYCAITGADHAMTHHKLGGGLRQSQMTESQLREKLQSALKLVSSARRSR